MTKDSNHAENLASTKTPPSAPGVQGSGLDVGKVLGKNYEILEKLGEGGMATVFKARQMSLNRFVAVKVMHEVFSRDPIFVERFEAEAGALANLSHPNIINIIEKGNEEGLYYFVMEYVNGDTLDQRIIENRLTLNDWRVVITACRDALDYVHKRGVIHRDIKPSNILIDLDGRPRIGDFGIAHLAHQDVGDVEDNMSSSSGGPMGTAYYMSPEQSVDSDKVDHRADIYALGVTFYKMMTRQLPIGEYPAPSEANHDVPVAVDRIVYQAMAVDPDERFGSVIEFCDQLLKSLKDKSVSITSILDYKSASGSSSLYTGKDFSSTDANRKIKATSKDPKSGKRLTGHTPRPITSHSLLTPTPLARDHSSGGTGVRASKDLTPLPVSPDLDPRSRKVESSSGGGLKNLMLILVIIVCLAGAIGGTVVFLNSGAEDSPQETIPAATTAPETDSPALSPAREREQRLEEFRRQQREQALRGSSEDSGETVEEFAPSE